MIYLTTFSFILSKHVPSLCVLKKNTPKIVITLPFAMPFDQLNSTRIGEWVPALFDDFITYNKKGKKEKIKEKKREYINRCSFVTVVGNNLIFLY